MKKFVFTLVVLLHLCYSYKLNMTLNKEILDQLDELYTLNNDNKLNITSPDVMRIPAANMNKHASSCVSVFVGNLRGILDNVMVLEGGNASVLEALQDNLLILDPHQKHDDKCKMVQVRQGMNIFQPYSNFVRKLNSRKR